MKRRLDTALSHRVEQMSTRELITTILVLVALITLFVLLAVLIGQTIDEGDGGIGWITLGIILV